MTTADRKQRQRRFVHDFIQALLHDDHDSACRLLDDVTKTTSGNADDRVDVISPSPAASGRCPLQAVVERAGHVIDVDQSVISGLARVCRRLIAAGVDVNRRYTSGIVSLCVSAWRS